MALRNYKEIRMIGKGSYGEVVLVKCRTSGKKWVLKKLNIHGVSDAQREAALQEGRLMQKLTHPNLVKYKEEFCEGPYLYIAMGYCEGGDLHRRLQSQRGVLLPEWQVVEWTIQVAMGLQHLHTHHVVHRDLKTQNIFLTRCRKNNKQHIKLGDLGIARQLSSGDELATTFIGTPYYMSPELFSNEPYNHKSDVWSLGCCVYEMATLKQAFNARDMTSLCASVMRGDVPHIPATYTEALNDSIQMMLSPDPDDRPTVAEFLRTPFAQAGIFRFLEESKALSNGEGADPRADRASVTSSDSAYSTAESPRVLSSARSPSSSARSPSGGSSGGGGGGEGEGDGVGEGGRTPTKTASAPALGAGRREPTPPRVASSVSEAPASPLRTPSADGGSFNPNAQRKVSPTSDPRSRLAALRAARAVDAGTPRAGHGGVPAAPTFSDSGVASLGSQSQPRRSVSGRRQFRERLHTQRRDSATSMGSPRLGGPVAGPEGGPAANVPDVVLSSDSSDSEESGNENENEEERGDGEIEDEGSHSDGSDEILDCLSQSLTEGKLHDAKRLRPPPLFSPTPSNSAAAVLSPVTPAQQAGPAEAQSVRSSRSSFGRFEEDGPVSELPATPLRGPLALMATSLRRECAELLGGAERYREAIEMLTTPRDDGGGEADSQKARLVAFVGEEAYTKGDLPGLLHQAALCERALHHLNRASTAAKPPQPILEESFSHDS